MVRKKTKETKKLTSDISFYRTFSVLCPKCSKEITAKHFMERLATDLTCPACGCEFVGVPKHKVGEDGRGTIWNREWLKDQIIDMMDKEPMISQRGLSVELRVSRGAIRNAFQELEQEGAIVKGKDNKYYTQ